MEITDVHTNHTYALLKNVVYIYWWLWHDVISTAEHLRVHKRLDPQTMMCVEWYEKPSKKEANWLVPGGGR